MTLFEDRAERDQPDAPFNPHSPAMQEVVETARKIASEDVTVLLRGENGTLLLDEIGDLPLGLQPKLLRFIEAKEYERVGDPVTRSAVVRLLAATNENLEAGVDEGTFRQDLLYRFNVIELAIPPLRDRPDDILSLARRFIAFFCSKYDRSIEGLTEEAKNRLHAHPWPGTVRELRNVIERAVILGGRPRIGGSIFRSPTMRERSRPNKRASSCRWRRSKRRISAGSSRRATHSKKPPRCSGSIRPPCTENDGNTDSRSPMICERSRRSRL